ncbi:unnamed protein product [Bursaphelenchus xylophilus]|uniref:(pine wood nematode) hypothetical protein n=1 Tax=Bursaphelenchus xylophilus TaxID=6326 RepID=A0A1I7SRQ0_BURXY|nr:unnamed protein product [Bursaphelenchus xylophilus]CAG9102014.1 unnamed protein product [Bursaphelenchus xylophilus]
MSHKKGKKRGEHVCLHFDREFTGIPFTFGLLSLHPPVVFLDTDSPEKRVQFSYSNPGQIQKAFDYLRLLCKRISGLAQGSLSAAGISPYAAAVNEARSAMPNLMSDFPSLKLSVVSIDQIQGKEVSIAVFITTRTAGKSAASFATYGPRITVALTRARDGLVVVGHRAFIMESSPELARLLEAAQL